MSRGLAILAAAFALAGGAAARAQIPLYSQRLPEGTVYIRLVNALPGAATVETDFAGKVALGGDGASRVSPYYVAGQAGGHTVTLHVASAGQQAAPSIQPRSGTFVTVLLEPSGSGATAALVTDKPEYNQLKARLSFYNATPDCAAGTLAEAAGAAIFTGVGPNEGRARSINPVSATVIAGCGGAKAAPLPLGELNAGGLYTVWMMRPSGQLTAFVAHDTIAPPRE